MYCRMAGHLQGGYVNPLLVIQVYLSTAAEPQKERDSASLENGNHQGEGTFPSHECASGVLYLSRRMETTVSAASGRA